MTGTTRVPGAEITGIFGAMAERYSKRKLGEACGLQPLAEPSHTVGLRA